MLWWRPLPDERREERPFLAVFFAPCAWYSEIRRKETQQTCTVYSQAERHHRDRPTHPTQKQEKIANPAKEQPSNPKWCEQNSQEEECKRWKRGARLEARSFALPVGCVHGR